MPRIAPLLLRSLLLGAFVAPGAGHAQGPPYKCVDPITGKITFQGTPCPAIKEPAPPPPPLPCELGENLRRRAMLQEDRFLTRFPDEGKHGEAEARDVKPMTERIRDAKAHLAQLAAERKRLDAEREFYVGKPLPPALKAKIDKNDAQTAATTEILRGLEETLAGMQARYRCERDTYGKLWKGAAPGSSACDRPACAPPA